MTTSNARVHFFAGQFLRARDFVDDQAYFLARARRHNIALHPWGIVSGLALIVDDDGELWAEPGVAIDGYGRDLVLTERYKLPKSEFDAQAADAFSVWMRYDQTESERTPDGYATCGIPLRQRSHYRCIEQPSVIWEIPEEELIPRKPRSVPEDDYDFEPRRDPPDDVSSDWPVFLGLFRRDADDLTKYIVDPVGRPYVRAVASALIAPWDEMVRVDIGGDEQNPSPLRVTTRDPDSRDSPRKTLFEVKGDGSVETAGPVSLHGDLKLRSGSIAFENGDGGETQVTDGSHPWSIQRRGDELRIEMGDEDRPVVVGHWSQEESKFVAAMTIHPTGDVEVHGNLTVHGKFESNSVAGPGQLVQSGLTAAAESSLLASFQVGQSSAGSIIGNPEGVTVTDAINPTAQVAAALAAPGLIKLDQLVETLVALGGADGARALVSVLNEKLES